MINSVEDIQRLVLEGFSDWQSLGHVTVRDFDGLLVFNYNALAQYAGEWNAFEIISRGLIIDSATGEIVARAFDKFFNWGEGGRWTAAKFVSVTEKMDGSLGILYRKNGEYRIATRGSLESEQALWATEYLSKNFNLNGLPHSYTLLFEIIYPENRIVVDYGNRKSLTLLAVRNRFTGEYLPYSEVVYNAEIYGFSLPAQFKFEGIETLYSNLEECTSNQEGYVAEFADGQRFKFKSVAYLRLHKLLSTLSFKNILAACESGGLKEFLEQIPDEFLGEVKAWIAEIESAVSSEYYRLHEIFGHAPKGAERGDYARWVMANHKADSKYLFALLDKRDIVPMIYKHHDWKHSNEVAMKAEG